MILFKGFVAFDGWMCEIGDEAGAATFLIKGIEVLSRSGGKKCIEEVEPVVDKLKGMAVLAVEPIAIPLSDLNFRVVLTNCFECVSGY